MRGRIRTIKPEFFLHEDLYDLEIETKLPIRLGYAGLWCYADREGRFKWQPRALGSQVLPYGQAEFSRVLDALWSRGFVVRYTSPTRGARESFGYIPTWKRHQIINHRESPSELPDPSQCVVMPHPSTREERVDPPVIVAPATGEARGHGHARVEGNGKGRELEGKEAEVACDPTAPAPVPERANGSGAAAAAIFRRLISGEDAARAWNASAHALSSGGHTLMHWRPHFDCIAAACNAEQSRTNADPQQVLDALVGWFWSAPNGPVATGRLEHPDPSKLAKYIDRDLNQACEWFREQRKAAKGATA